MNQSILDHPLISERYFYPRAEKFENPYWVDCGDARLSCSYHQMFKDSKTVVFFHGNGEIVSDYFDFFLPVFEQMGLNLFLAEYRGYSMSSGIPALKTMLEDVEKIIKSTGQPPEKLILFGRSIGSLYAVHGAHLFPNIAGLIIESGVAVLLERVLMRIQPDEIGVTIDDLQNAVNLHFNHREKLSHFKGSTLVMHSLNDSLVHSAHGKKLFEWAPNPKSIKIFDDGDHNDIMAVNFQEYFQLVYRFISGEEV